MSGSFVIAQHTGIFNQSAESLPDEDMWIGSDRKILGIYSGRLGPSDVEAQLGIVWSYDYIDEIVSSKNLVVI